ncbi:MAG TPA: hypothetical protein VFN23_11360 [Ktedonobacteraceae bacterium]|nr:hypothetical protein [Ktedonobacteraceae bacterium]
MTKTGPRLRFHKGMGILPVVAASMMFAATTMGASAAPSSSLHTINPWLPVATHSTQNFQGTITKQTTMIKSNLESSPFTLSSTETIETCQNSTVAPTYNKLAQGKFWEYASPGGAIGGDSTMLKGTDNAMWYVSKENNIVRANRKGVFTVCPIPSAGEYVLGLANGPDGAVWFTETSAGKIGRIKVLEFGNATDLVSITEFSGEIAAPTGIATGPDHNLWFSETDGNRIDEMSVGGTGVSYTLPTADSGPAGLVTGPQHSLWFTEVNHSRIGRITTQGVLTEYTGIIAVPIDIAVGPDNNLWYTDPEFRAIGRLTPDGESSIFGGIRAGGIPIFITNVGDGKTLAFSEGRGVIGRITTSGHITEIGIPNETDIFGIAASGDGCTVAFTQYNEATLGKFTFKD